MPDLQSRVRTDLRSRRDPLFMELALAQAATAALVGEVPVGAVVTVGGEVSAVAANGSIHRCDPTAHAEIVALRAAARRLGNYRLSGATVYVTVEPCCMCVGALIHARIERLVFGCREPKSGAVGSALNLGVYPFEVVSGVCAERAAALLQAFFQVRRGA